MLCASSHLYGQAAGANALPPGDGKDLVVAACTQCHGLGPIVALRDGPAGWKNFVYEMVLRGSQLSPREADTVTQYLVKNFGPASKPMTTGTAPEKTSSAPPGRSGEGEAESLPAGPGKELVESRCTLCHDLGVVTTLRRSKEEWDRVVKDMVARGSAGSPEEIKTLTGYLAAYLGK